MKLPLLIPTLLTLILAVSPLLAQSDAASTPAPAAQVAAFFQKLTEGRVEAAYDELLKGTKIAAMPKDVAVLKSKTKEAIKVFGNINGYELVHQKEAGTRLVRLICISHGKEFPIRWRFYFYKGADAWKLIDIRIDDRLRDLFEEPAPAELAPASAK